jgi:molecular chaperone GrpE (heat shock protein)
MYEVKIKPSEIGYSLKKIEEFTETAKKTLQNGISAFTKYKNLILNISLLDVVNNIEKYKTLLSDMNSDHDTIHAIFDKLFDVVDKYDILDMPDNIRKLEDLVNNINDLTLDIYYLMNALENIIEAGEDLNKQYSNN